MIAAGPLVSVITPTLNQARWIESTLRSIQGQSYDNVEHIVIDGGSTDSTAEVLARHSSARSFRWVSEPDSGMYDAINKGLAMARGEILAYLNSDDLYLPWTLETVVSWFEADPEIDVLYGDVLGIDSDRGAFDIRFQPLFRFDFLLRAGSLVQPGVFWRRRVYEAIGGMDLTFRSAGDLDYWLRIGPERKWHRIDEILAVERDHADTKRASQWATLMAESRVARGRLDRAPRIVRFRGLVAGRFRAWWARRLAWFRFARATRQQPGPGRRWGRFLSAADVRLSAWRLVVAQLPWIGRRFLLGVIAVSGLPSLNLPDTPETPKE